MDYEQQHSKGENYIYHQNDVSLSFPLHLHNSFELLFCLEGSIEVEIESQKYNLQSGEVLLINPLNIHAYKTTEHSLTYLCIFSNQYISDFYEKYALLSATNPIFTIKNTKEVIEKLQTNHPFYIKSALYDVIIQYINNREFCAQTNAHTEILKHIVIYISQNYKQNITLTSLSQELGYSYNYISAQFKKYFNNNFLHVVNSFRISCAKRLLKNSALNITNIASECGFDSLRTFNRVFLSFTNITPKQYRNSTTL
ncbi:MAG: AraC family transcriptional regulator [Bacillota bacterium]